MVFFESFAFFCVQITLLALLLGAVAALAWVLYKIGFLRWLRGWLWYFGLVENCPDTKKRNR